MTTARRWYTEPETFIAVAALIVSISAVAVGLYEAALQRHHDRAEVWPHPEIQVFTKQTGAAIMLENTGIGPAIVQTAVVTVDGRPQHNWSDVLRALNGIEPSPFSNFSTVQHGLRPGDRLPMIDMPVADTPRDFWKSIARVGVSICYSSVFDQHWVVESKRLGGPNVWRDAARCPDQADSADC
jgi:hypothetical protein